MGAGIVILFWLVILAILGTGWVVLLGLAFLGWMKKWPWLKWGAGLPALLMALVGLLVGALLIYGIFDAMNPKSAFKTAFGKPPPPQVSNLESRVYWFADTGSVYLTFKSPEDEFLRCVPEGLMRKTSTEMEEDTPGESGSEAPTWWKFRHDPAWIYYLRSAENHDQPQPGPKGFYFEVEYMAYDPSEQRAYYRFLGID